MHNFKMKLKTIEENLNGMVLNEKKTEHKFQDKIKRNNNIFKRKKKTTNKKETLDYDKEPPIVIIILNI